MLTPPDPLVTPKSSVAMSSRTSCSLAPMVSVAVAPGDVVAAGALGPVENSTVAVPPLRLTSRASVWKLVPPWPATVAMTGK